MELLTGAFRLFRIEFRQRLLEELMPFKYSSIGHRQDCNLSNTPGQGFDSCDGFEPHNSLIYTCCYNFMVRFIMLQRQSLGRVYRDLPGDKSVSKLLTPSTKNLTFLGKPSYSIDGFKSKLFQFHIFPL